MAGDVKLWLSPVLRELVAPVMHDAPEPIRRSVEVVDEPGDRDDDGPVAIEFDGRTRAFPRQWFLDALAYSSGAHPHLDAVTEDAEHAAQSAGPGATVAALTWLLDVVTGDAEAEADDSSAGHVLELHATPEYLELLSTRPDSDVRIADKRRSLFDLLGVVLPPFGLVPDTSLTSAGYRFVYGSARTVPRLGLVADQVSTYWWHGTSAEQGSADDLRSAQVPFVMRNRIPGVALPTAFAAQVESTGWLTWDPVEHLLLDLGVVVDDWAWRLQSQDATVRLLDELASQYPVVGTRAKRLGADVVHGVFVSMLRDHVPIRNVARIAQLALRYDDVRTAAPDRATYVRWGMAEEIGAGVARHSDTVRALLVDPVLEAALDARFATALTKELADLPAHVEPPVLITSDDRRAAVAEFLRARIPSVTVVSLRDLPAHLNVQPVARVS
ncbi:FHIPEP family type III secretion protein [Cellulomonas sp. Leaf334]|uniref:FHIPEP family type III secretion protein n=1 Tax=Cellulomonas sp. Leaf334 TaxID=1736339 RepID=UPI0006F547BB|nr:FHIPEP family type III secretion protein [Cellulomonas sp. Leaf334]KQR10407.1 hypothetical protein ASF78_17110 [Cellulomonas sp. Leaf334]